jgi:hypothetical protein
MITLETITTIVASKANDAVANRLQLSRSKFNNTCQDRKAR